MHRLAISGICIVLLCSAFTQAEETKKQNLLEVEGRGIRDTMQNVWDFFFGEGSDYDYNYDYDFNPNEVSSYTWYNPASARRESIAAEDEDEYSWGEVALTAALAVVPIGLLLAFPTGLFTIAVKKRSFEDDSILNTIDPTQLPLLKSLQEGDLLSLVRPQCQKKLFCELSQLGRSESASLLQKAFYYVSHLMPDNLSKRFRLQRVFELTRANECETFTCHNTPFSYQDSPSNHLEAPLDEDI